MINFNMIFGGDTRSQQIIVLNKFLLIVTGSQEFCMFGGHKIQPIVSGIADIPLENNYIKTKI